MLPVTPFHPESSKNKVAWIALSNAIVPVLTVFGKEDPINIGGEKVIQHRMQSSKGQEHAIVEKAAHFIQEDAASELIERVITFCKH